MEFQELVPVTPVGRVFERELRPGMADGTPSGRVRLDAIARWAQDLAWDDIVDAGVENESLWVVRRMRVRAERFPRFGEPIHCVTFCSGYSRLWAERRSRFEGADGALVDVAGLWVHLSPATRQPVPLPESFDRIYAPSAQGRKVKARLRHPNPPAGARESEWFFRASDADLADHVNNAAYWEVFEERLGDVETLDAEIEFREPAQPGVAVVRESDGALWVAAGDGRIHASIAYRGRP